jgi:probable phosphoglycerate mutase
VTAIHIATEQGMDVQIEEDLTEIDHGRWNGLMREEVEKQYGPLLQVWQSQPSKALMPGGEDIGGVAERSLRGLRRIVARHPDQRVLIATHDAVLRVIICHVLGLSLDQIWCIKTENASVTWLEFDADGDPRLIRLNDTCHLANLRSNMAGQAL